VLAHALLTLQYAAFEDNDKVYLLQEYAEGVSVLRTPVVRGLGAAPQSFLSCTSRHRC
jgi:hypothetical protein